MVFDTDLVKVISHDDGSTCYTIAPPGLLEDDGRLSVTCQSMPWVSLGLSFWKTEDADQHSSANAPSRPGRIKRVEQQYEFNGVWL